MMRVGMVVTEGGGGHYPLCNEHPVDPAHLSNLAPTVSATLQLHVYSNRVDTFKMISMVQYLSSSDHISHRL